MTNVMAALTNIGVAPSVQRRKVWLTPTTVPCSNTANTRNPLKLAGVPQTNEMILAVSRPKFTILWGHVGKILLFNKFFFPIVDTYLSCDSPTKLCDGAQAANFFGDFCVLHFQRAACGTFQTCILNSH